MSSDSAPVLAALAAEVLDAAPDGLAVVRADGTISYANSRLGALFGYAVDDLVGEPVEVLVPDALRAAHQGLRSRFAAAPETRPMGSGRDLQGRHRDGHAFPIEISLSPLVTDEGTHVVAAVRDISDRLESERRTGEMRQTLDASEEGVVVFDARTLLTTYVNRGAAAMIGVPVGDLIGRGPHELLTDVRARDVPRLVAPLIDGSVTSRTFHSTIRRDDGSRLPIEIVLQCPSVLRSDGSVSLIAFCHDISERLEADEALRAAERELELTADRERIARELHDTVIQRLFAAGMSLQALLSRVGEEEAQRLTTVTADLDDTIHEIRTAIFALTAHTLPDASVRRRLLHVAHELRDALPERSDIGFHGAVESLPDDLVAQAEAVLREGLANAAKHAAAGRVRARVTVERDRVQVTVEDDGHGMEQPGTGGHGIENLRSRARVLGGEFDVGRSDTGGTFLRWSVPVPRREA
ncbi:MAG: PAS domain-containing sensor histidine kinase [Ilumatobacteraceae bacterium]